MPEAVIVEAVRSPVGKRNGGLSGVHPAELSAQVLNGLVERAGVDPALVDDVIWGCVMQAGEQALDIARTALLTAGWPESVPGVTVTNDGQSPLRQERSRLHELWSMRVLRPNSVWTGCTERQFDFSPQSPHPSQMRSLIRTRRVGVGMAPRLRLRRFSAAQG